MKNITKVFLVLCFCFTSVQVSNGMNFLPKAVAFQIGNEWFIQSEVNNRISLEVALQMQQVRKLELDKRINTYESTIKPRLEFLKKEEEIRAFEAALEKTLYLIKKDDKILKEKVLKKLHGMHFTDDQNI